MVGTIPEHNVIAPSVPAFGSAGCGVLLFTQAQVVVSNVNVSQQFTFAGSVGFGVLLFTQAQLMNE
jgi:hypothetical protein